MALGIRTSRYRRANGSGATTIDGLPVILKAGTVRYVDGTLANTGAGTSFANAHNTIQRAVDAAGLEDTVFVRPKALGTYYTESVIVPATTHRGLSIVGTGNGKGGSVYQAVTWRNSSNSVDDSALDARSGHMNVENIHFFSRAAQSSAFGVRMYWNTGSGLNIGSSIVNCGFSQDLADHPPAAGVVQSAVRFDSTEGQLVEGCFFVDCRVGIAAGSTMNAFNGIVVKDNLFQGLAANIAADLMLADGNDMAVIGNIFGHTVPSHAAGTMAKYIFVVGGATVTGIAADNHFGSANAGFGTDNTASSFIRAGNTYSAGMMTS